MFLAARYGAVAGSAGKEVAGMVLLTPTSIAYTGTSASIGANGSVTFTAVESLSLNGVFDATYNNYFIALHIDSDNNFGFNFRMRSAGTDDTTANSYASQRFVADSTSVTGARFTANLAYGPPLSTTNSGAVLYAYGPYLAQPTAFRSVNIRAEAGGMIYDWANSHNQSTSYDGITFLDTGHSNTGLISVYGLVGA